jgi:hypothetical protein
MLPHICHNKRIYLDNGSNTIVINNLPQRGRLFIYYNVSSFNGNVEAWGVKHTMPGRW